MERLYRVAPAAVLALRGAPEAMLACKGATRPHEAQAGTIRVAGEHLIFNFAHCPDDAASAPIELAYLVGREQAALMQARAEAEEASAEPVLDHLHMVLPAYQGWEAISFPMVANRVRARAIQRRFDAHAYQVLFLERQALLAARSPGDRLRVGKAANATIRAAMPADPGLEALADLYEGAGPDRFAAIEAMDVYFTELELATLDAQAHANR
jgi:hypothetical protein